MEGGSTGDGRPCRVLLIDDNRTEAELVEAILGASTAAQFDVVVAESLADGLAWLARQSPDIILLDLTLPDSARLQTFRAIRNRSPRVPVVVITSLEDSGLGRAAVQQGAQDFLTKGRLTGDRLAETLLFSIERARRSEDSLLRDPLTGLASQPLLRERVIESLGRAEREKRYVAVLAIGVGDFGAVDSRFGANSADELLFGVAERLCEVFPPPAALGRVGVDEFAVVLGGLARPSNAERAAQRVLGALAPEFRLGVGNIRATVCIGIAMGRVTADGPILLDRARAAMIAQRRSGEQGVRLA